MTTQPAPNITGGQPQPASLPTPRGLTLARRMALPPEDAIRPHDERTANRLHEIKTLEAMESQAAMAYQRATGWAEALRADRDYVRDFIHNHNRLPAAMQGPHPENFRTIEALHTQAFRQSVWVDVAREDLIAYLHQDHRLQDALSAHADLLRDEICGKWIQARDSKDRRALEAGWDLAQEWLTTNRLHSWAVDPSRAYQSPLNQKSYPGELSYLEWEADAAVNGEARPTVPIEASRLPGAPLPAGTTSALPAGGIMADEGTVVNGEPVRRGLFRRG